MQKSLLKKAILGISMLGMCMPANAQLAPKFEGNWHLNYVDANFAITSPASIAGAKKYTLSSSSSWGRAVDSTWINVPIVKAYDTLGINPLLNGSSSSYPSLVGKFALIYRGGGITFTQKACYCQAAGAIGVIIVNNVPGDPAGMANTTGFCTVNIPVLMVSDVDGNAINSILKAGQSATLTLTGWATGFQHDLAVLSGGPALWHSYAVPSTQVATGNGNPKAYQIVTGAFLANFGTANETNVKLVNNVTWTPTSGAASQYYSDSVTVPAFSTLDSVIVPRSNNTYDLHASSNGRFDVTYSLSMANADQSPSNNSVTYPIYVNDSIFSKGRYDFTKGMPTIGVGYRATDGSGYVWGPTYYIAKGGYAARKVQFTVTTGDAATPLAGNLVNLYLFRWVDGSGGNPADGVMQNGELSIEGTANKTFSATDTNYQMFTVNLRNPTSSSSPIILKDSSWYWVAADMPSSFFLGCDGDLNYYSRSYIHTKLGSANRFEDVYAPILHNAQVSMDQNPTDTVQKFPFESASIDSVRYWNQDKGIIPSIALHISKAVHTGVGNTPDFFSSVELYPNPANTNISVRVKLEKAASNVYFTIADGFGKTISREQRRNLQQGEISLSTANLPAGQYYLIINADDNARVKQFTVVR